MVTIGEIKRRSTSAVCGLMEREVVVNPGMVAEVKRVLRTSGFIIVGTGQAPFGKIKIWFNPAVSL